MKTCSLENFQVRYLVTDFKTNEDGILMKLVLPWNSLHKLYSGLIGKSIFIISLIMPVAKLSGWGLHLQNYNYYFFGSILISIGFMIEKISLPVVFLKFDEPTSYASHLLERDGLEAFDDRFEFAELYRHAKPAELVRKSEFGENKFVYYFGVLNFYAIDASKFSIRVLCTIFFAAGIAIFYFPMMSTIISYFGGLNVA
jgi:hypothetical protein